MGKTRKCIMMGVLVLLVFALLPAFAAGAERAGEELYNEMLSVTRGEGDLSIFARLNNVARDLDWTKARSEMFVGNLRRLTIDGLEGETDETCLYLLRTLEEDIYILSVPTPSEKEKQGVTGYYANLDNITADRSNFSVKLVEGRVNGEIYTFARLSKMSERLLLDRIFEICCTLMLFLIMVGMGLTLQLRDFSRVLKKPKAMFTGAFLQWVVMPLLAVGAGRMMGYHEHYPYIFIGIVLIAVCPGGTTSNLMTYFGKGDLALSISLTSFSTVLSLVLTPLLLILYCANVSDVPIPAMMIVQIILMLVIVPLALGMLVKNRWPDFAQKAVPYFSILGIAALFIIIGAGILTNLEKLADTERYGLTEYTMILVFTFTGVIIGIVFPKLLGVNNYQVRALSLETGLRNSILAMTIAIMLQDIVGDFHSSMFAVSAVFGIGMYFSGFAAIYLFRWLLPLDEPPAGSEQEKTTAPGGKH